MKYDVIYGGIKGSDLRIYAKELPDIPAAKKRIEEIEIPGRDGKLYMEDGSFEETEITINFNYIGPESLWNERWRNAQEWLGKKNAELIFADDPDYYLKVNRVELGNIERTSRKVGNFAATFLLKDGLHYLRSGKKEYPLSKVLRNPYLQTYPVFRIKGNGQCNIKMNGNEFSVTLAEEICIDTERRLILTSDGTIKNTSAKGDYEGLYLLHGKNRIVATEGFEVTVIPNWRRL